MKGIDISHWNTITDYAAIKNAGYDFAIIKAGGNEKGRPYKDVMFEEHYKRCKEAGLYVGAYFYGRPLYMGHHLKEAQDAASYFLSCLDDKIFDMPVYLDFEEGIKNEKDYNTMYCDVFCRIMETYGAFVGIYGSDINTFKDMVNIDDLFLYSWWVARYGKHPEYATENLHMWQHSSKGSVPGIKGNTDLNVSYIDFPKIINKKNLNRF